MNDNQIIQALKICKLDTTCVTCPYYGKSEAESCFSRLSADALSIIHKQKKQINQLTHKHYNECGQIAKYSDELNQFVNTDKLADILEKCKFSPLAFIPSKEAIAETEKTLENVAKLEAISGKNLDDIISLFLMGCTLTADKSKTIDNLVKEMTGGDEE